MFSWARLRLWRAFSSFVGRFVKLLHLHVSPISSNQLIAPLGRDRNHRQDVFQPSQLRPQSPSRRSLLPRRWCSGLTQISIKGHIEFV
ncbi:hypothetical protein BKA67DRAFT_302067 [Truncatella angustata]|uniref:Uncharacterized protein n=1 Tax=Truncatella angustata TaxID=152316 RepID=A0A9P8ZVQ4_9PEZI|nr:uncharacterized protein BKA67DRAFT_302067 [Truncatella angustata]KAH6652830.1 hypothetical protein BKA67DRAFT_302067 [Truncatella angustata]